MGFSSVKAYVDAYANGQYCEASFHKISLTALTTAGRWYDTSMWTGNPKANVYPGGLLAATKLWYRSVGSLWHGGLQTSSVKHVQKLLAHTASTFAPCVLYLCDYLQFYPLIDLDESATQEFDNTTTLSRFQDGKGVLMMLVTTSDAAGTWAQVNIEYTNHEGVTGRILAFSPWLIAGSPPSHITTSDRAYWGPFLPLASGDLGVRSVQSITLSTGMGGGYACLVLVKPILTLTYNTVSVPRENDYFLNTPSLPRIHDEAYLSFLMHAGAAVSAGVLQGYLHTIWG